ncbi:hypothetical protein CDAR_301621 [Caerostris darwini]|uniref:Uncharacterized protein n=1 Tax=Caerostris darwini TaxID=1538125 RepID=A0AAV4TNA0_9ARAC|nr:hypothetical protein CDAR_301621 [Caerostris darwini]
MYEDDIKFPHDSSKCTRLAGCRVMCCSKELELTLSSCSSCSERTSSHFLIVLSEQQRGGQIIKLAIQREEESLGWMELRKQLIFE